MRHVDTLSTIYRHVFHSKLPTKSLFVEEKKKKTGQKLILCYLENSKLPTKSLLWRKNGQNWYYIIQKILERPILPSHMQCLLQKQTSHWLPPHFNAIQHKGDILQIRTCGDFYLSFVYRYCHEQLTCRTVPWIFRQSITALIWIGCVVLSTELHYFSVHCFHSFFFFFFWWNTKNH